MHCVCGALCAGRGQRHSRSAIETCCIRAAYRSWGVGAAVRSRASSWRCAMSAWATQRAAPRILGLVNVSGRPRGPRDNVVGCQHASVPTDKAARRLKMPLATVSRCIADLEDEIGVRILERSTRCLRLTDIGAEVLEQAQRGSDLSDAVESIVSNHQANVSGLLRIAVPPSIADAVLGPLLVAFQASYPNVRIQLQHRFSTTRI
jgi:regulatory helix-turn-helix LysR family protein/LysR substrate binding domain-containing protein